MVLTGSFVLSPVTGLCCHRHRWSCLQQLDASVGASRPAFYSDVMTGAMREIARVLKPNGWATVVFHNTDAAVWEVIREAASAAGFEFHDAGSLDRQQQSHKGYKGRSGQEDVAHFDVVFNLRKAPAKTGNAQARPKKEINLVQLVVEVGETPRHAKKGLQGIHAEVMRRLASKGSVEFADYSVIRKIWEQHVRPQAAE